MAKSSHTKKAAEKCKMAGATVSFSVLPGSKDERKAETGVACRFAPICLNGAQKLCPLLARLQGNAQPSPARYCQRGNAATLCRSHESSERRQAGCTTARTKHPDPATGRRRSAAGSAHARAKRAHNSAGSHTLGKKLFTMHWGAWALVPWENLRAHVSSMALEICRWSANILFYTFQPLFARSLFSKDRKWPITREMEA